MPDERGIYWLASYPKSGNTWFRIFLAHILDASGEALDLNQVRTGAIASARGWVDEALGFDSSDLSHDDLDALRPAVHAWHAKRFSKINYHKVHDAYTYLPDGNALLGGNACLGAIYFIRNPLDVVVSFANHSNYSIDKTIAAMSAPTHAFNQGIYKQHEQLRQKLLSWSMHVKSWREAKNMNCLVIRYEDMKQHPISVFTKAIQFLKLQVSHEEIERALGYSDIKRLQDLEKQHGFKEKPADAKVFFRKGVVGDWRTKLTSKQVDQVIQAHGTMMEAYGYL
ncbi:MAG: sulfotransferase domain-containing protein [Gammaproteobacteria bacterium]|nr:sulfotransferase domain-containing protein [Gammaproteobacteria bacterium]MCH9715981.1 sulfotransferase domain-containing protein [Gammaproteobacteria bacterium]MCH9763106.1 sulfotransferase domain-containing protein [Gammaproteobacteria bacterium]